MTVISLVSTVLLVACVASGNPISPLKHSTDLYDASILQNREVSVDYEPLGCYITRTIMNRKVFKKFTDKSGVPQDCIEIAMKKSYSFFGILQKKLKTGTIQYRCLTGNVENATATKYKWPCKENVGKSGAIFIYKKVSKPEIKPQPQFCKFKNRSYSEGKEVKLYQSNNDTCSACECSGGKFDCRTTLHCDTGLKGCNETYHPPGECCPDCKPNSCEGKKVGDTWFKKGELWSEANNEDCVFCRCTPGFQKTCDQLTCLPPNCKKPEIPEGKCCAECREEEKVTTEPPSFVIILPTTGTPTEFKLPWER